jgi:glycosyltransferase involved in cell wall biosynthesis
MPPAWREPWPEAMPGYAAGERLPLVSVVVPMHNAARRIDRTLRTVICQTYPRLEVILVDDGSDDETSLAAAGSLRASSLPWRLIETPNQGPSKARNIGWRAAQGRLIQFLDDDDEVEPDKIEHQVDWLTRRNSEAAAIYSTWAIRNTADTGDGVVRRSRPIDWQTHDVIRGDAFLPIPSCLMHKGWLEKANGFDEGLKLLEDIDMQIRILALGGKFEEAPSARPLFFYNQRPGSLSQAHPVHFADACLRNARLVYAIAAERGRLHPALIQVVADVYRGAISAYAQSDRPRFETAYREFRSLFPGRALQDGGRMRHFARLMGERRAELLRGFVRRTRRIVADMLPSVHRA